LGIGPTFAVDLNGDGLTDVVARGGWAVNKKRVERIWRPEAFGKAKRGQAKIEELS
jgi:hypothetical protein